jgi:16S rRNA (guanine(966)-N(2))-methyltransferase RsmD
MRVIAGSLRGRNLKTSDSFRPTTDRVRETLFNILQNEIEGSVFIDAFAGSGAVGIEAISRGAKRVFFIDSGRKALNSLEDNLAIVGEETQWRVYSLPVLKALEVIHKTGENVDVIFFDPPYNYSDYTELLTTASELFPDALVILETSSRTKFTTPDGLSVTKEKRIGETLLTFYKRKA